MRRPAPRPLRVALDGFTRAHTPATVLARVQGAWPSAAGPAVAAEAEPVAEHGGTLTVSCRSAVWAHELSLVAPEVLQRLNAALEPAGRGPLRELRVRTAGPAPGASGPIP